MFLFTNRATPEARAKPSEAVPFAQPLKQAARSTGVSFEYLTKTAEKESGFRPDAKAGTSSATGMFQFIEQTWLATLKAEGPKVGLSKEAAQIDVTKGKFSVADPVARQRIMALREDPSTAAMMAGAFAARNGQKLKESLGRAPSDGELYLAHFLGPTGAADFLALRQTNPQASAVTRFPDAASANRNVFFDEAGKARTVEQVFERITAGFSRDAAAQPDLQQKAIAAADGMFRAKSEGKHLHGLFRSSGEPVSEQVSQMFTGLSRFAKKDAAAREALAQPVQETRAAFRASASASVPVGRPVAVNPAETAAPKISVEPRKELTPGQVKDPKPLDLMRFVKF
jgi:Transglycosylase SLT domain